MIKESLKNLATTVNQLLHTQTDIDFERAYEICMEALCAGRKLLICGNGGSFADAAHFTQECTGKFKKSRKPFPCILLGDGASITCIANDFGFEEVFARQIEALGNEYDVLIMLSTSGRSPNVRAANDAAIKQNMATIGLFGEVAPFPTTVQFLVPSADTAIIQELHMHFLHTLVGRLEDGIA